MSVRHARKITTSAVLTTTRANDNKYYLNFNSVPSIPVEVYFRSRTRWDNRETVTVSQSLFSNNVFLDADGVRPLVKHCGLHSGNKEAQGSEAAKIMVTTTSSRKHRWRKRHMKIELHFFKCFAILLFRSVYTIWAKWQTRLEQQCSKVRIHGCKLTLSVRIFSPFILQQWPQSHGTLDLCRAWVKMKKIRPQTLLPR